MLWILIIIRIFVAMLVHDGRERLALALSARRHDLVILVIERLVERTDGCAVEYRETTIALANRLAVERELGSDMVVAQRLNHTDVEAVGQLECDRALRKALAWLLSYDDHADEVRPLFFGRDLPWRYDVGHEAHKPHCVRTFFHYSTCQLRAWPSHLLKRRVIIHRTMK